jgi:hypothetical protein
MTPTMSTGAQTLAIPRVPSPVVAGADTGVAAPERVDVASEESVQYLYEAGLAKLHALHDRWAAAVTEVREAQTVAA